MPREVVLVGGGHAHVQVMTAFAESRAAGRPWPDARLTLVSPDARTPYSGMLPGHVAGLYDRDEMHIDLDRLAAATGTRFVQAAATGLDRAGRQVRTAGSTAVPYDLVSFDVGITPDLSGIAGADSLAVAVKPIGGFLDKLSDLRSAAARDGGPVRLLIVGGGPAGVELAFALRARLRADRVAIGADPDAVSLVLATSGPLLKSLNAGLRRRTRAALAERGIVVREGVRIAAVSADGAVTEAGERLPADRVVISTKARAPAFLADFGLPTGPDGSLLTRFTLQSLTDPAVFAVGDCATVANNPNQKAGVFAVRQGPVLADNLARALAGKPLRPFRAQTDWLVLMTTGDGNAIGGRGSRLAVSGRWVWRWKDHIDRAFMARFMG
ncbi:FAD-dependent oxidoreductase [Mongoliimonas terrestris]|uniref:FAD-dependent oxidoreductase n=1 Tax=Mongoliimonas terrestris TaxID=1709001 RepID=UPI000949AFCD|nr:FAD-dependent oxidoreductase [Mongoliimonas terrestris]